MATNRPEPEKTSEKKSPSKKSNNTKYEKSLAYERAFLKKKEALEKESRAREIEAEMEMLRKRAAAEIAFNTNLFEDEAQQQAAIAQIRLRLAQELSKKQLELVSEKRATEYAAHQFAVSCARDLFQTQNVHERAKTSLALAEEQKVQTEKLRQVKEAEIAELESAKKGATSRSEKAKITRQIHKLQQEIADAENLTIEREAEAAKYAEIVKKVDFERLSIQDKIKVKKKELADLEAEADASVAEIDSAIAAKQLDLEAATESGNTDLANSIREEIATLRETRDTTSAEYASSIETLRETIDGSGGLVDQAANSGIVVTPPTSSDNILEKVDGILSQLTEFVSSFRTYVDAIESKVTQVSDTVPTSPTVTTPVSKTDDSSGSGKNIADYLMSLVNQTTIDDADTKAALTDRITKLGEMLNSSDGTSAGFSDEMKSVIALIAEFFDKNAESGTKKDSKKDSDKDSEDKDDSKKSLKLRGEALVHGKKDPETGEITGGRIAAEKEASRERTIEAYAQNEEMKHKFTEQGSKEELAKGLQNLADGIEDLSKQIDQNIKNYYADKAEIDARLNGSNDSFTKSILKMSTSLGLSAIISQKDFMEEFKKLVDAGITYNLESRTLLATVSNKVVNTFEVLSQDLQRLIRLQQADTTAARLGLESLLNQQLNQMYSDTSYLSDSGSHDNITGAILEASSLLSRDMSVEFEYMVHKWLGSLYSLGFSDGTLQKIAQGLNYLGTGNVSALNNDDALQTLLAMSASYGGIPYAEILTKGLNAETTNKLLAGMTTYLVEIAKNTDSSQVVKSAYSDVFGLEVSDLRAVMNLTTEDIKSISDLTTSYKSTVDQAQSEINRIFLRTHVSQLVDTLTENALIATSLNIGSNAVTYGLWKAVNLVEAFTGGIALPFVNVFGSGFDLNTTVTQLIKGGMAGLGLLASVVGAVAGGLSGGSLNLSNWSDSEYNTRGSATLSMTAGIGSGMSSSGSVGGDGASASGGDMKTTEMSDATDTAEEDSEVTNKNVQDAQEIPEKIYEQTQLISQAVANEETTLLNETIAIRTLLEERLHLSPLSTIASLLGGSRVFLTSDAGHFGNAISLTEIAQSNEDTSSNLSTAVNYLNAFTDELTTSNSTVTAYSDVARLLNNASSQFIANSTVDIWDVIAQGSLSLGESYLDSTSVTMDSITSTLVDNQNDANKKVVEQLGDFGKDETLKNIAIMNAINKIVFPEYVRATVDSMSPEVQKFLEQLTTLQAKRMWSVDSVDIEGDSIDEKFHPLVAQLRAMLNDPTMSIPVTQSFASSSIQGQ